MPRGEHPFFEENAVPDSPFERNMIVFFRLTMAWTFLYAASHQIFDPQFTVAAFLSHTKTFHNAYAVFTTPAVSPYITFLVSYGHLLIGLSLLVGLMVRVSAAFGIALMLMYWTAHMDWPFIENANNFIVDYHIVYAGVLVFLIGKHAGHVWGLDGWVEKLPLIARHPSLRPLVA
jgi:thiosulfate dehydrogenase [quinone] large subunit